MEKLFRKQPCNLYCEGDFLKSYAFFGHIHTTVCTVNISLWGKVYVNRKCYCMSEKLCPMPTIQKMDKTS